MFGSSSLDWTGNSGTHSYESLYPSMSPSVEIFVTTTLFPGRDYPLPSPTYKVPLVTEPVFVTQNGDLFDITRRDPNGKLYCCSLHHFPFLVPSEVTGEKKTSG